MTEIIKYPAPLGKNLEEDNANFMSELVSGARDSACIIYRAFPGYVQSLAQSGNLLAHLMNSVCGSQPATVPLPPAPSPPFTGGQCATYYTVAFRRLLYSDASRTLLRTDDIRGVNLKGPIGNSFPKRAVPDSATNWGGWWLIPYDGGKQFYEIVSSSDVRAQLFPIVSVTRFDNLADNCGNPPTSYPNTPPTPDAFKNDKDGFNFTLPVGWITNNISPEFKVDFEFDNLVGEVKFDFSGATVNFGDGGGGSPTDTSEILSQLSIIRNNTNTLINDVGGLKPNINLLPGINASTTYIKDKVDLLPDIQSDTNAIKDEVTKAYEVTVNDFTCGEELEPRTITYTGLEGIAKSIEQSNKEVVEAHKAICEVDAGTNQAQRFIIGGRGAKIPQLQLFFFEIIGTTWSSHCTQLTIPYPSEEFLANPELPEGIKRYQHGSYELIAMLPPDDLKIAINCISEEECIRMLNEIKKICPSAQNAPFRIAKRFGEQLSTHQADLRRMKYFENGTASKELTWVKVFKKPTN